MPGSDDGDDQSPPTHSPSRSDGDDEPAGSDEHARDEPGTPDERGDVGGPGDAVDIPDAETGAGDASGSPDDAGSGDAPDSSPPADESDAWESAESPRDGGDSASSESESGERGESGDQSGSVPGESRTARGDPRTPGSSWLVPSWRGTVLAVLAVAVLGLAVRLYDLGWRVAHQDEGRVADWILHYMETGTWSYRPIIHGPFLPHVNGVVFDYLGPSDFTMRLVVAVVGALLPLSVLLFRDRLRNLELVALAGFLAANPILLYYSRFMRNDVPLAVFMFVAFALYLRAHDRGRPAALYLGAAVMGLAFTTKENALVYPLAWAGSLFLVVDHRVLLARHRGRRLAESLDDALGLEDVAARDAAIWGLHALAALLVFSVVVVAFYAPKPELYNALGNPVRLPGVVHEATVGSWNEFLRLWGGNDMRSHDYLEFFGPYVERLWFAALPVVLFAVVGFLADRYRGDHPRMFVAFCFYWGVSSVVGYPLIMDINAAWSNVHAVVPLAVPAAVGLAYTLEYAAASAREVGLPAATTATGVALLALVALDALLGVFASLLPALDAALGYAAAGNPGAVLDVAARELTAAADAAAGTLGSHLPVVAVAGLAVAAGSAAADRRALPRVFSLEAGRAGGLAAAVLLLAGSAGAVAYDTSFANPQSPDNRLVQYAQPSGEMQATLADVHAIADSHEGVDVLYYGSEFYTADSSWPAGETPPGNWFNRLPLPWYVDAFGAEVDSTTDPAAVQNPPPVVITYAGSAHVEDTENDIEQHLQGYERRGVYQGFLWGKPLVVYVDTSALPDASAAPGGNASTGARVDESDASPLPRRTRV